MNADVAAAECAVRNVHIRGATHTHPSVIRQELRLLEEARTLGDIGKACASATGILKGLDLFESVVMICDTAGKGSDGTPLADVTIHIQEKKRLASASTGVHTQNGEGSFDAAIAVRNLVGYGERINFNSELGQQKSNSHRLAVTKPRLMGMDATASLELSKSNVAHMKRSSFVEKLRGGRLSCTMGQANGPLGSHEIAYELQLRDVCKLPGGPGTMGPSWAILQQRGVSVKSSLSHTFALADIDHPLQPTRGYSLRVTTELAGTPPLGDASFHKQTVIAALHAPLLPRGLLTLSLDAKAGLLLPLRRAGTGGGAGTGGAAPADAPQPPSCICDRFFLGGPGSMWGFRTNGVGPRDVRHTPTGATTDKTPRDALGGDVMGVATATLSAPLPGKLRAVGARAHAFASAGGLESLASVNGALAAPGATLGSTLAAAARVCVGVGVGLPTQLGLLSFNFTHVLKRRPMDITQRSGWQVGVSGVLS